MCTDRDLDQIANFQPAANDEVLKTRRRLIVSDLKTCWKGFEVGVSGQNLPP